MVAVYDGTRQPFPAADSGSGVLITVRDGNQKIRSSGFHNAAEVLFQSLPFFDNFGDDYTFLASAKGYKDAGIFPVKLAPGVLRIVELMLIPGQHAFNFANARWSVLGLKYPELKTLLGNGAATPKIAAGRYGDIQEDNGGAILACLLNIVTAMSQVQLPRKSPFDYLKQIFWDRTGPHALASDRFFAWADPDLLGQVLQASHQIRPEFEPAPGSLHPGATRSFKQIEFGEANLQLTFHENDQLVIDGVNCILVEPDIDYYRDSAAHLLLEVAVNAFGAITDPATVYALRWIAGRRAGVPEFNPPYTIVEA